MKTVDFTDDSENKIDLNDIAVEANDRLLRLYAEFDNYKKRINKEKSELIKTASEEIIISLLPIIDDLERSIKSHKDNEGIKLIYHKFMNILKSKGVESFGSSEDVFDTDYHEAIANISSNKKGIIDIAEKGYLLNGKVIRFAKVIVGN
jgi:molecular chaperone GrpE